jgi:hypothetical protein
METYNIINIGKDLPKDGRTVHKYIDLNYGKILLPSRLYSPISALLVIAPFCFEVPLGGHLES